MPPMTKLLYILIGAMIGAPMGLWIASLLAAAGRTEKSRAEEPAPVVSMNVFDQEDIYPDCTVQVLTNTVTGETSVGWWRNDEGVCPDG